MKKTEVIVTRGSAVICETLNKAMMRLRKKLKVGAGGMEEREWYSRLAEAYVAALDHVKNNLDV